MRLTFELDQELVRLMKLRNVKSKEHCRAQAATQTSKGAFMKVQAFIKGNSTAGNLESLQELMKTVTVTRHLKSLGGGTFH